MVSIFNLYSFYDRSINAVMSYVLTVLRHIPCYFSIVASYSSHQTTIPDSFSSTKWQNESRWVFITVISP